MHFGPLMRMDNRWDTQLTRCITVVISILSTKLRISQVFQPPVDLFAPPFDGNGAEIQPNHYLILDDVVYHRTSTSDVSCGFAEVDVRLDDNGVRDSPHRRPCDHVGL